MGIYALFEKFDKVKQLQNDSKSIRLALTAGNVEISEWLLFSVIQDTKTALKLLDDNLRSAKKTRIFVEAIKEWLNKLICKLTVIEDLGGIIQIFSWIMDNVEDIGAIQHILSKIPTDDYNKGVFLKKTRCLTSACSKNRRTLLEQLLKFMGNF